MQALARPLKWPPVFPLEKGLVLWLPFDDRSGARAMDRSGKRNHGALYGPTWVAGRRGSALSFDGVDDYVEVLDHASLDAIKTVEFWLYLNSLPSAWRMLISKGTSTGSWDYRAPTIFLDAGNAIYVSMTVEAVTISDLGSSGLSAGKWIHVVFTADQVKMKIYLDGVLDSEKDETRAMVPNDQNLRIGATADHISPSSIIDKVRVYNRALNAAEVKRLYESELPLTRW